MTPDELFIEWGSAFATRDDNERERRLRACCADDVEFIPPDERPVFRGLDALIEHVGEFTAAWPPGTKVSLARPAEFHHGWSRGILRFEFPDRVAQGTEIARIDNGKIASLLVFRDPS